MIKLIEESMATSSKKMFKVLVMCDNTGSMGHYLAALTPVMTELYDMCRLIFKDFQMSIMMYGDYDIQHKLDFPPVIYMDYTSDMARVRGFIADNDRASGGGDDPEAHKTAFMMAMEQHMLDENTMCIHYTDTSPHLDNDHGIEADREKIVFSHKNWNWRWQDIVSKIKRTHAVFLSVVPSGNPNLTRIYSEIGKVYGCDPRNSSDIMAKTLCAIQNEMGMGEVAGNPSFVIPFSEIARRLYDDRDYFQSVVNVFKDQMERRGIDGALDLLCNKITSEIWRTLCKFRDNENVVSLRDKMSRFTDAKGEKEMHLRTLLEASYDREGAFNEMFEHLPRTTPVHVYRASSLAPFRVSNLQDLFNLFSREEIAHMIHFIHGMQEEMVIVRPTDSFASLGVIPIDVPNGLFFSVIPHLITRGYVASHRHAAIVALLCLDDARLMERARLYLTSIKGKWLNFGLNKVTLGGFTIPENLNLGFAHFVLNERYLEFLTPDEIQMLRAFVNMSNIHACQERIVQLQITSFTNPDGDIITTDLFTCSECHRVRPISLRLEGTNKCAWCDGHSDEDTENIPHAQPKMSNVTCCKCKGIYANYRYPHCTPKCHYCRNKMTAPLVACRQCHRMYIYPDYDTHVPFVCHECLETPQGTPNRMVETDVRSLFANNPSLGQFTNIHPTAMHELVSDRTGTKHITLFEKFARSGTHRQFSTIEQTKPSGSITLFTKDKEFVCNTPEIISEILRIFRNVRPVNMEECMLCTNTVNSMEMVKICMRPECHGNICVSCAYRWLSTVMAGELIEYAQCCCPFCRQPFSKKMANFHPIARLTVPPTAFEESLTHYMAWCISCNCMKPHSEHQCNEQPPVVHNFICEDCVRGTHVETPAETHDETHDTHRPVNTDRIVKCRHCQSFVCKALIINDVVNRGCNHVQCGKCKWHVCAFPDCGQAFESSGECYGHMHHEHGGFYDPDLEHHHDDDDDYE